MPGDYPHVGMDANVLYITTNEFNLFSPGIFHGFSDLRFLVRANLMPLSPPSGPDPDRSAEGLPILRTLAK